MFERHKQLKRPAEEAPREPISVQDWVKTSSVNPASMSYEVVQDMDGEETRKPSYSLPKMAKHKQEVMKQGSLFKDTLGNIYEVVVMRYSKNEGMSIVGNLMLQEAPPSAAKIKGVEKLALYKFDSNSMIIPTDAEELKQKSNKYSKSKIAR